MLLDEPVLPESPYYSTCTTSPERPVATIPLLPSPSGVSHSPPLGQQVAPPHRKPEQRTEPFSRLISQPGPGSFAKGPRLSATGLISPHPWPNNHLSAISGGILPLDTTATTITPIFHQTVMAPTNFRLLDSDKVNLHFPKLSPLPWHNIQNFDIVTHFSDHTLFIPHLLLPWPADSLIQHLSADSPFQAGKTLLPDATTSALRLDHWFLDSDFNLPKGFLTAHPTVSEVINTDTKLLPSVPVSPGPYSSQFRPYFKRPAPTQSLKSKSPSDYELYSKVIAYNRPNYIGAKVDLNPNFPVKTWEAVFSDYNDKQLVDFMRYGWPTSFMGDTLPTLSLSNHASSIRQPKAVQSFLDKEVSLQGLAGPFTECPFEWLRLNPMMTREKKNSDEYRVILDLSFPEGHSVNACIPKLLYEGAPYKLRLPTSLDMADLILKHGKGTLLYKIDLSRAYRQLPIDPHDWPLLGIGWQNSMYFDRAIPFGIRPGVMCCSESLMASAM